MSRPARETAELPSRSVVREPLGAHVEAVLSALPDLSVAQLARATAAGSDAPVGPVRAFEEQKAVGQAEKRVVVRDWSAEALDAPELHAQVLVLLCAAQAESAQVFAVPERAARVEKRAVAPDPSVAVDAPESRDSVAAAEPGRAAEALNAVAAEPVHGAPEYLGSAAARAAGCCLVARDR